MLSIPLVPDFVIVVVHYRVIAIAFFRGRCTSAEDGSAIFICFGPIAILVPSVRRKTEARGIRCKKNARLVMGNTYVKLQGRDIHYHINRQEEAGLGAIQLSLLVQQKSLGMLTG